MKHAVSLLFFASVFCASQFAFAGPWTKSIGELYVKAGNGFYFADGFVDADGEFQDGTSYFSTTPSIYAEVGVWKKTHVSTYIPFVIATNEFEDGETATKRTFGDLNLGLQFSPFEKIAFGVGMTAKIPLYDLSNFGDQDPAPGDGQMDLAIGTSYGMGFAQYFFFAIDAAYQFRTDVLMADRMDDVDRDFSDTILLGGQLGVTIIKPTISASVSTALPTAEDAFTKGYVTTGLNVFYSLTNRWAAEGGFSLTPWARNSARGTSISLGVSFRL